MGTSLITPTITGIYRIFAREIESESNRTPFYPRQAAILIKTNITNYLYDVRCLINIAYGLKQNVNNIMVQHSVYLKTTL